MQTLFFVLGKNPTLSTAEILSVLSKTKIPFDCLVISEEVLVISISDNVSTESLIKILGGTIKIGIILDEISYDDDEQIWEKVFYAENLEKNYFSKTEGKIHFGISIYDGGAENNYISGINNKLMSLNSTIKDNLRDKGIKAGFVRIKDRYISSVSVSKNQLLTKGMEIVLILTKEKVLVGKTQTVQEFESFSFRDYGRPQRNKRSGIIPPKLARMMINLSNCDESAILMDPFCGSGTIIQEAIILGYKNIIGLDISINAVNDTQKNIEWLFDNYPNLDRSRINVEILSSDVKLISNCIKGNSVDAIVTEPYLGPPLFKEPDENLIQRIIREVESLYLSAFQSFYKILKKDGKVVFVFPAFETYKNMRFVQILKEIEKLGFGRLDYFPETTGKNSTLRLTPRGTILYGSPEQFVKREITLWQKK